MNENKDIHYDRKAVTKRENDLVDFLKKELDNRNSQKHFNYIPTVKTIVIVGSTKMS